MKFLILLLAFTTTAFAQDYIKAIEDQMDVLQNISLPTAADSQSNSCTNRYDHLLKDGVLNILIGFGYIDTVPKDVVHDWYMVNGLRRVLTGPCRHGVNACEFAQSREPGKYYKTITDRTGKKVRVEIMLIRGSLSGSHAYNLDKMNFEKQKALCGAATDMFFNEMMKGPEIVYYSGHSRDGGGPDFCPPTVLRNGHVNYNWYQQEHPGFTRMLDALARAERDPQVLVMHSCMSISHFYNRVHALKPKLAFMGSRQLLGMVPDYQNQYGGMDSFIGQRCEKGMKAAMSQGVGFEMVNLFTK